MRDAAANPQDANLRSPIRGLVQIVRFNWPQYIAGAAAIFVTIVMLAVFSLPALIWWIIVIGICAAAWWLLGSLAASWWIYDLSPLTRWDWLRAYIPKTVRQLVNIHSGFDDTSLLLRDVFSDANLVVLDLYDPQQMTEPSIHRARRHLPPIPGTLASSSNRLPSDDASADGALVLLAAHELRAPADREAFFRELSRITRVGGRVVLVEHARDAVNFLAFGPGFWHFLPFREWRRLAQLIDFRIVAAGRVTPFVRFLVLEK